MIGQRESHKMKRYVLRCFGMESTSCSTIANHRVTLVKKQAIRHKWRKKRSSSYMFYYEQQHGCHKWNMNCLHSWSSTRCLIRVVVVLFFFFFRFSLWYWWMVYVQVFLCLQSFLITFWLYLRMLQLPMLMLLYSIWKCWLWYKYVIGIYRHFSHYYGVFTPLNQWWKNL